MVACPVCGGVNFEIHAGFKYCTECQTQSQDYHEEEYEFRQHDVAIRKDKSSTKSLKGPVDDDCGSWTSWELFNHILFGMTQELKPICKEKDFETMVLKIWACYLNRIQAGFLSTSSEDVLPKLNVHYRGRDAKIIYNLDAKSLPSRRKRKKAVRKKKASSISNMSDTSMESKRSRSRKRMKVVNKEYEDSMSKLSMDSTLANETLESLGRSSDESSASAYMSDADSVWSWKSSSSAFTKKARKFYKKTKDSQNMRLVPSSFNNGVVSKTKLLAVISLALILIKSDISLGDILRFIREGHLSFAKVTHFLPRDIKIPRSKDYKVYFTESDIRMPCHYSLRLYLIKLAKFVGITEIALPNTENLVSRYCEELKLPDQIKKYSIRIMRLYFNNYQRKALTKLNGQFYENFEAIAMACIIVVLKFYFGLDDKIEMILSRFAKAVNQLENGASRLFVFEDWQKYIECRKLVLTDFHYATQERFDSDHYGPEKFMDLLIKESKDEFISERFRDRIYKKGEYQKGIQEITSRLAETKMSSFMEFPPSLTPLETYIKIIKEKAAAQELNFSTAAGNAGIYERNDLPWNVLNMEFKDCDITFTRKPQDCIKLLEENSFKVVELSKSDLLSQRQIDVNQYTLNNEIVFVIVDGSYWTRDYKHYITNRKVEEFQTEIFDKLSNNFQWLLLECARVIENQARDLYIQVFRVESRLSRTHKSKTNILTRNWKEGKKKAPSSRKGSKSKK